MALDKTPYDRLVESYTYTTFTDGGISGYVATVQEFPGRSARKAWPAGAIADLKSKIKEQIKRMDAKGEDIPDNSSPTGFYIRDEYEKYLDCDTENALKALRTAALYGHSKDPEEQAWIIDQMVRALTGQKYSQFVDAVTKEDNDWNEGTVPRIID